VARPVCLIVNPSAGGGRAARELPAVEAALGRIGLTWRTEATRDLGHARQLADEAARAGETAVTLGGDGLTGAVAGELRRHPGAVLGILPGGRGNDFARVLGLPSDPAAACELILHGEEREIDLGEVQQPGSPARTFVGIASAGFDSVANEIANRAPNRLGNLVYAYGALRALASWRPAGFDLELDGTPFSFRGFSVAAANSKAYGGGMYVAPDAELDDGLLDVVISHHASRLRCLAILSKVFRGEHVHEPTIEVRRCAELRVSAERPFAMYADGDPIGDLPVTVRACPRALRVLVAPRSSAPLARPDERQPPRAMSSGLDPR
jgi:YegS/Rv2252/BmrU family lipid kinase